MNYTINQNNSEKIINLIVKVGEWSECKNLFGKGIIMLFLS